VNSVVAGAFVGVLTSTLIDDSTPLPAVLGAAGLVASLVGMRMLGERGFRSRMAAIEVRFPPPR
jgi:hypothetical protein